MTQPSYVLQFGIPSLDKLIGVELAGQQQAGDLDTARSKYGILVADGETLSTCLIGGDGTGKSVLAMHWAAAYRALTRAHPACRVIYASTDLSAGRAKKLWENFALGYAETRIVDPFDRSDLRVRTEKAAETPMELRAIRPLLDDPNDGRSPAAASVPEVEFIDLATNTAGDDWGFLNRLTATLSPVEEPTVPYPHLLIIDAVEGLEVLVGKTDAYGERRERRSRVAQIVRAASGKCHLMLLVEDARNHRKVPEEFVSDAVIRLGFRRHGDYSRRVVKIEKVRGQSHVRGTHDLAIRSGRGSSTGKQINYDDPEVVHPQLGDVRQKYYRALKDGDGSRPETLKALGGRAFQSYMYVFPSLHHDYRSIMEQLGESLGGTANVPLVNFGIPHLDELLTPPNERRSPPSPNEPPGSPPTRERNFPLPAHAVEPSRVEPSRVGPANGVPANVPVALIGEQGTFKSRLSRAYLARAFYGLEEQRETEPGVAILLSTQVCDHHVLTELLSRHGSSGVPADRVICRRLEVHNLPPAVLLHIVRQAVRQAQWILFDGNIPPTEAERRKQGHRIRFVFNNWTTFRDMHPEIDSDSKALPNLVFFLQRERIATLFVANEDHGFRQAHDLRRARDLHELTGAHVYTWNIPFFGEGRIAISAGYRINAERRSRVIRELRPLLGHGHVLDEDDYQVGVNPTFELYDGLEEGKPRYVDLKVYLYGDDHPRNGYVREMRALFSRLLHGREGEEILVPQTENAYETLRNFSELQGASRFPYTLVLQVDEFWAKSGPLPLSPRSRYLEAVTATSALVPDPTESGKLRWLHKCHLVEDALNFFQPTADDQQRLPKPPSSGDREVKHWRRLDFFHTVGYSLAEHLANHPDTVVKVPYTWDFGFLMCARQIWEGAAETNETVRDVWSNLPKIAPSGEEPKNPTLVGWEKFARACEVVANYANTQWTGKISAPRNFVSFSVAPEHQETLCCLLLEIWASLVDPQLGRDGTGGFRAIRHERPLHVSSDDATTGTLVDLADRYDDELYEAIRLLGRFFDKSCFDVDNRFVPLSERGSGDVPVAARHWYASAADFQRHPMVADLDYVPVRLPGRYSVRGDWFLAVARGSRSILMGDRAIDLLSTRRANIVRLQTGMGLPVRDHRSDSAELWTSIWRSRGTGTAPRNIDALPVRAPFGLPDDVRVDYDELLKLGGPSEPNLPDKNGFRWLWRSRIRHYDRHSRILRRWLCSLLYDRSALKSETDFKESVGKFLATLRRGTIFDEEPATRRPS